MEENFGVVSRDAVAVKRFAAKPFNDEHICAEKLRTEKT